ncbi:MAG: choice-of-anchor D domain-containing protein [Armatimonadetes bacterium]|nr:choice-of-anchor D domain-containing protein [Armatimonadota bacterium]
MKESVIRGSGRVVVGGQWPVVSGQWSVVSGQWSVNKGGFPPIRHSTFLGPILLWLLFLVSAGVATAGGPLGATGTTPYTYPASALPIVYKTDLGALGRFSNAVGKSIADYAFQQWDNVATASLTMINGGTLANNVTSATDPYISGVGQFNDGINPVVFDHDGSITDSRIGVGARNTVYGFAASVGIGTDLYEGFVIINGNLSGTGSAEDEDRLKAVITHEAGHFLGLAHAQNAMHAGYATMYPSIESLEQKTLEAEDVATVSLLYPTPAYLASVGFISGTVRTGGNAKVSGVCVIAVDTATGNAYSTIVDYYSGGHPAFENPPAANGTFTISGLPPGYYAVRIEPVIEAFKQGSSIASYSTPINTNTAMEWYNNPGESADLLLDNWNDFTVVRVQAGDTTKNIAILTNQSTLVTDVAHYQGGLGSYLELPVAGTDVTGYASRFTAPSNGSLVGIKLLFLAPSVMPVGGSFTVSVYSNKAGSLAGIPNALLGSVTIPYKYLMTNQENEIWLRGIGALVNFSAGEEFHVAITNSLGALVIPTDGGTPTQNRSSYKTASGWKNFPDGVPGGAGVTIWMTAVYTTVTAGSPQAALSVSPNPISFGTTRPGKPVEQTVTITNPGTAALNVSSSAISGANQAEFSVVSGGGPFTVSKGGTHQMTLRFNPTVTTGNRNALLVLASNAPGSPLGIQLNGIAGQSIARELLTEIDVKERRIGATTLVDTLVLQNNGSDTLRITDILTTGADSARLRYSGAKSITVAPGASLKLRVRFDPQERRRYSSTIRLLHDDTAGFSQFAVYGTGVAGIADAPSDTLIFPRTAVQAANDSTFSISNSGDYPLTVTALSIVGSDAAAFAITTPSITPLALPPGQTLAVPLRYTPDADRRHIAQLRVAHNGLESPTNFTLIGYGPTVSGVQEGEITAGGVAVTLLPVAGNPVRDAVEVAIGVRGIGSLSGQLLLVDMSGKQMLHPIPITLAGTAAERTERIRIELDGTPSGAYQLLLQTPRGTRTQRVVVVR